ncbi:methyltransferase domain-containing protein [Myroides pelagicus]|uniref:Methyltransferase domain-containing protein n=1 Tax=Myroides pelagicus TaxID=270914 RepID=A0A7K1GMY7_9FLAO|nr:methyltransferase domain-containing protein [Myroides pelagicus]MEC4114567.1 methyltransferase domain-containing protein [Myroides pelagicus]MTH30191.1 methyltransferase domain-containing protein [Myroides pelagicus]
MKIKSYWESRYLEQSDHWNAKGITTPIKDYIDQLSNKDLEILIPGLGHGHELLYLHEHGFSNINGLDLTDLAVQQTVEHFPQFPVEKVILSDFFSHEGQYDLILEQTFFCSLPLDLREKYVMKMRDLLKPQGKLVGVLFDCIFAGDEPPFGGSLSAYKDLFDQEGLSIQVMERAYNSIKPRENREVFIIIEKQ